VTYYIPQGLVYPISQRCVHRSATRTYHRNSTFFPRLFTVRWSYQSQSRWRWPRRAPAAAEWSSRALSAGSSRRDRYSYTNRKWSQH